MRVRFRGETKPGAFACMAQQFVILIMVVVLVLGGGGYFAYQNYALQNKLAGLAEEKASIVTELAVLKATDLAKEVEIMQLKLKTAERDFAAKEKELAGALQEKASAALQLQTARANSTKIRSRLDAIDATERMIGAGPNAQSVASVDAKISAVKDADITEAWAVAKRDIDFVKMSWNGNTIAGVVMALTRSIRNLLP